MRPDPLQQLREVHAVQGRDGCWDIDDYMLGLYNGLELALSLMEQRDVHYKKRQAIAEAEKQEPVAFITNKRQRMNVEIKPNAFVWMPTTTDWEIPLYTHPQPKREWVGLTDEDDIDWDGTGNLKQLVEAIEAKLKEQKSCNLRQR